MAHNEVCSDEALELAILEGIGDEDVPAKVREYVDSDRMIDRLRLGDQLSARVLGNYGHYIVRLSAQPDGLAFSCSCPSYEYPCKHARALALTYIEMPDTFSDMAGVRTELERRSKSALVDDLLHCISEHPRLLRTLGLVEVGEEADVEDEEEPWEE